MKKTLLTSALILASTISIAYAMCEKANIAKPVYSTNSRVRLYAPLLL